MHSGVLTVKPCLALLPSLSAHRQAPRLDPAGATCGYSRTPACSAVRIRFAPALVGSGAAIALLVLGCRSKQPQSAAYTKRATLPPHASSPSISFTQEKLGSTVRSTITQPKNKRLSRQGAVSLLLNFAQATITSSNLATSSKHCSMQVAVVYQCPLSEMRPPHFERCRIFRRFFCKRRVRFFFHFQRNFERAWGPAHFRSHQAASRSPPPAFL